MKKKYIFGALVILGIVMFYFVNNNKDEDYENIYIVENVVQEETKIETIKIHIVGEVLNPGIYEIEENSRIDDLIKIAGGITENADLDKINLAYEVSDGEKIYIPSIFDEEMEYNVSSDSKNEKININKANIEELQKINGVGESLASKIVEYRKANGKFSSIDDLKNVSGIGEKKFESIKNQVVVK